MASKYLLKTFHHFFLCEEDAFFLQGLFIWESERIHKSALKRDYTVVQPYIGIFHFKMQYGI